MLEKLLNSKLVKWLLRSNRWKHFVIAIPCAIALGFNFVLGLGLAMEFKDYQHGGNFDIIDLSCTLAGGIIGAILRALIFEI